MAEIDSKEPPMVPGDCVLFATADWDEPYWTNKQHCAKELTRLGWRVLYVESLGLRAPKAGSKKDIKRLWLRLCKGVQGLFFGAVKRDKNLWVLSPLAVPGAHGHKWLGQINMLLLHLALRSHVNRHSFKTPLIWTYHPYMLKAIVNLNHGSLLYHCVDALGTLPGVDQSEFQKAEQELLQCSDVVFATTELLAEKCKCLNKNTYFLPNVVDVEHFSKALDAGPLPYDLMGIPEPRIVYHGVLSDFKIDFELLYEAARLRPEWQWVLIGDEREGQKSTLLNLLSKLPNVHCIGYRPYRLIPEYLRGMSVGLLPSRINDYTNGMFPMKFFEYIAAGLPIVSTRLRFAMGEIPNLLIADSSDDFVSQIEAQLMKGKSSRDNVKLMIGENTWHARINKMLKLANNNENRR